MKRVVFTIITAILFSWQLNAQFTNDPAANTQLSDATGEQAIPKIAVCTDGSMYVSWFSNEAGNYNVRLQYLNQSGAPQWAAGGILVSDQPQMTWLTDYSLATDPSNYAIVTFQDVRNVDNNPVGYRVSPTGEMAWGADGIMLSNNANFEPNPRVCATEEGNIVFAWQSSGDVNEIHMQKVSPSGDLLWGDGIALTETGIGYTSPFLQSAGGDHVFLIWHKETGPFWAANRGTYVQKLDIDGSFMWASDVVVFPPIPSGAVVSLEMCMDDMGGIVFSKYGNDAGTHFNCWVQHMDASGNLTMPATGALVATNMSQNHMYPAPAYVPETQEVMVFFSEQDLDQNQRGLYAQKFDLAGNRQWTDNGKVLIPLSNNDYALPSASGYMNQAICVYEAYEFGNVVDSKVQAVMLDTDGNYVWDYEFIDMSIVQSQKMHRVLSPLTSGQWVSVWEDERNGNSDIYAQNIHPDGSLGEAAGGDGKLLGFVRDAVTNLSIDGATISATNTDDGYQTSITPFGSHYSFMVPQGTYNLTCDATGYTTATVSNIEVVEFMNTPYNFYLSPSDHITGVNEPGKIEAMTYPNPFLDNLSISLPNEDVEILNVEIQDIQGRIVKSFAPSGSGNVISLPTTDMQSGIYFYKVETLKSVFSGKIVKN